MATNREVAQAWKNNQYKRSSNGKLRTDGSTLWSYQMEIGRTTEDGRKVALDVSGKHFYSQTTSCHVGLARGVADKVVIPVHVRSDWAGWRKFPDNWADGLIPVETEEAEAEGLHFACMLQDTETLQAIWQMLADPDITAVSVGTETGDYAPIYVRYGYPSYRTGGQWFKVVRS